MKTLKISKDFSMYPGARYYTDGPYSGEKFYEECLKGAFYSARQNKERLTVDLDGTAGYASSFLSESFGLLAQEFGIKEVLDNIFIISNEEPDWKNAILTDYLPNSKYRKKTSSPV